VSFLLASISSDAVVGYSIGAGDWYCSCLCKSHAVQGVSARSSASSRAGNISRGIVLLWDLVTDQDAVSGRQISRILIVAEGILVLKENPKASIPVSVGTFQKR